ncbi:cytochrome c [Ideonella sp. 4Y16]|uniref:Cytochrome c n=1 Tax=Ideonella alba TaxID=2824118 RepID=A0A940Y468_9BURK|nr:cytochrome c [Ideonella alba]MBQ0929437.1 cytochrome c [Ideonella alba]MBQ0944539.1 cytochrome c [Ideonella alba]
MRPTVLFAALLCAVPALAQVTGRMPPPRSNAEVLSTATSARSLYVVHCAGCHGRDGAGSEVGRVPDMRGAGHFLRLDGGRQFLIQVPGVMGSGLDDAQVAEVTNWVLATLAAPSVPAQHQPYTADEVRRARTSPPLDVAATRDRLVAQARTQGLPLP